MEEETEMMREQWHYITRLKRELASYFCLVLSGEMSQFKSLNESVINEKYSWLHVLLKRTRNAYDHGAYVCEVGTTSAEHTKSTLNEVRTEI